MGAPSGNGSSYTPKRYLTDDPFVNFIANAVIPESFFKNNNPYVDKTVNSTISPYPSMGQMFPNLNTNLAQPQFTGAMQGAGRFRNLLDAPINYSAPSNSVQNNYEGTYQPTQNPNPEDILKNWKLSTLFRQMAYTDSPELNAMSNFLSPVFPALDSIPMTNNTQGK